MPCNFFVSASVAWLSRFERLICELILARERNWPAPNVWVLIAQMVEHCGTNVEAVGSNPFEVPKFLFSGLFAIALIAITTATIMSSFKYRKIPKISPSMYKPLQIVTQKTLR